MNKVGLSCFVIISSLIIGSSSPAYAQTSGPNINWLEICRNPIVDFAIAEPCDTLATPDGYTLTAEGQRVFACIIGGGMLLAADPTGQAMMGALTIGRITGICGGSGNSLTSNNLGSSNNPIGNVLNGLFGR